MQTSPTKRFYYTITPGGNVEPAGLAARAVAFKRLRVIDVPAAQRFFSHIEVLACEAKQSSDPRLLALACEVLAMQAAALPIASDVRRAI